MWTTRIGRFLTIMCLGYGMSMLGHGRASDGELGSGARDDESQKLEKVQLASISTHKKKKRVRYDYSRFSDGPRWVPRARGASLRRAQALGIGTYEAAKELLRSGPPEALRLAAGDEKPKNLLWPVVDGHWGRGFGYTRKERKNLRHNGVDFGAPKGALVRAAADGIVVYSDNGIRGFGNVVMIVHANGWLTVYAHNLRTTVQAGWKVKRGERIALVGATGIARGPHLHFELRDNGRLRNPAGLFVGRHSKVLNGPMIELSASDEVHTEQEIQQKTLAEDKSEEEISPTVMHSEQIEEQTTPTIEVGSVAIARHFLSNEPSLEEREAVQGRVFRNLLWPVRGGKLGRSFDTINHLGVDIEVEAGEAVRAAADGLVLYSGDGLRGYGNVIIILHRNGWVSVYGSNRENAVKAGDNVQRGAWIARVGSSAVQKESHLHFEVLERGKRIDPQHLFVGVPEE